MGAGASSAGAPSLPANPAEWDAKQVELGFTQLGFGEHLGVVRKANLTGPVLAEMQQGPAGLAEALRSAGLDEEVAGKAADALGKFAGSSSGSRLDAELPPGAVEVVAESAGQYGMPKFEKDDHIVLQLLFGTSKKVALRTRDMGTGNNGFQTQWWLLQCDVFAHTGQQGDSCLVRIGPKGKVLAEAECAQSMGPRLGTHCPRLLSVVWHGDRAGARFALDGALWGAPALRATPHTLLLHSLEGVYKNRMWALLSGRLGSGVADGNSLLFEDDAQDVGSLSSTARASMLAFGGGTGVGAVLDDMLDGAVMPLLSAGRRRVATNLFRHYNIETDLTSALMLFERMRDNPQTKDVFALLNVVAMKHPSALLDVVTEHGGVIDFFRHFASVLASSEVFHAEETADEAQRAGSHGEDGGDPEPGAADADAAGGRNVAPLRWVAPSQGSMKAKFHLLWLCLKRIRQCASEATGHDQDMSQYHVAMLSHALKIVVHYGASAIAAEVSSIWGVMLALSNAAALLKTLNAGVRSAASSSPYIDDSISKQAHVHETAKYLHATHAEHVRFDDPLLQAIVGSSSIPAELIRSPLAKSRADERARADKGDSGELNLAAIVDDDAYEGTIFFAGLGPMLPALQALLPEVPLKAGRVIAIVGASGSGKSTALRRLAAAAASAQLQWFEEKASLVDYAHRRVFEQRQRAKTAKLRGEVKDEEGKEGEKQGDRVREKSKDPRDNMKVEQLHELLQDSEMFGSDMLIPLLIPVRELAMLAFYEGMDPLNDDIIAFWIRSRYGSVPSHISGDDWAGATEEAMSKRGRALLQAYQARSVMLFLDGLDEVPVFHSEMAEFIMIRLAEERYRLVVFTTSMQAHAVSEDERALLDRCEQVNFERFGGQRVATWDFRFDGGV
eukprot:g3388.t1